MGNRTDMAVIRRDRSLALGVMDSIAYASNGRVPAPRKPRVLATLGSYCLALCALVGFAAAVARMVH